MNLFSGPSQVVDHGFATQSYSNRPVSAVVTSLSSFNNEERVYSFENESYAVPEVTSASMLGSNQARPTHIALQSPNAPPLSEMSNYPSPISEFSQIKQEDFQNFPLQHATNEAASSPNFHSLENSHRPTQLSISQHKFDHFKRHASLPIPSPFSPFLSLPEEEITPESQTAPIGYSHPFQYPPEQNYDSGTPDEYYNVPSFGSVHTPSNAQPQWNFDSPSSNNENANFPLINSNNPRSTKGNRINNELILHTRFYY